jgi:hypothetical protein
MKGTKPKTTAAPATKQPAAKTTTTTTTTPSSSGQRNPGTASKYKICETNDCRQELEGRVPEKAAALHEDLRL